MAFITYTPTAAVLAHGGFEVIKILRDFIPKEKKKSNFVQFYLTANPLCPATPLQNVV